jgi:endonuclease/exonuclease/phosphatase family metal-dependent hydrolase
MAKRKKRKINFLKLFKYIILIINIIFAFGLLFTFIGQYIKPSYSIIIAFSGLGFPYLIIVNLIFVFFWLFFKARLSLISLILVLININNVDKFYQLNASPKPESCVNSVKVMSYNVRLFGLYNSNSIKERMENKEKVLDYFAKEQPDILCIQEFFFDKSGNLNFNTLDTIVSILNLRDENFYFTYFPYNRKKEYFYGYATFSKYRIINSGVVFLPDSQSIAGTYIDFKYKGDTIRNYNIHLASNYFDQDDDQTSKQLLAYEQYDSTLNMRARVVLRKMKKAVCKREMQAQAIQKHISESPYRVIVCGDLNDPPFAYTYHKISEGLKDSFRESGKGVGRTYHGEIYPSFRIDNIFHSNSFKSYGHTVSSEISISDHYPIFCYISLMKKN